MEERLPFKLGAIYLRDRALSVFSPTHALVNFFEFHNCQSLMNAHLMVNKQQNETIFKLFA